MKGLFAISRRCCVLTVILQDTKDIEKHKFLCGCIILACEFACIIQICKEIWKEIWKEDDRAYTGRSEIISI